MKTNLTKICAGVFGTMLLAGAGLNADAQVSVTGANLNYTQDFNTLENGTATNYSLLPNGWAFEEFGTSASVNGLYRTGNGSSNAGDTYSFGATSATDRAFGAVASGTLTSHIGVKFVNNTGAVITGLNISYTGEQWRDGLATGLDTLAFKYSTTATSVADTASANWTDNAALTFVSLVDGTTGGTSTLDGNVAANRTTKTGTITVSIPVGGTIILKWADLKVGGANDGLAIDDLSITFSTGTPPVTSHIILETKVPTNGATNVPLTTDKLVMVFDSAVAAGTGSIKLIGGTTPQVFTLPSTAVTFSNDSVVVNGISLENNTSYHVEYDSTVATNVAGTMKSIGIYNATTWTFSTVDTVTPPPPTPLTSLNETFTGCVNSAMNDFIQYSVEGSANWRCSTFGNTDSASVYVNGGSSTGVSTANKDWLITKAPLDFSAMTNPMLSFYQKKRFEGNVTRTIRVSTNFVAGTDPTAATWTTLSVQDLDNAPTGNNVWSQVRNINLTAHKATPFYLAFTYECGTDGAYELTYDDIKVENATSIKPVSGATVGIHVIGEATTNQINLNIEMNSNDQVVLELFDLLGRKVSSQNAKLNAGNNRISMSNLNLSTGMYVVRVIGTNGFGTVKAVVK